MDSKHLADQKMLDLHYEKVVPLPMSGEAEVGSGGDNLGISWPTEMKKGLSKALILQSFWE